MNSEQTTTADAKKQISEFKYNRIDYRTDNRFVDLNVDNIEKPDNKLIVDTWHKTAGEEWGNCAGTRYKIDCIGRKYVKLESTNYRTNTNDYSSFCTIPIADLSTLLNAWREMEECDNEADQYALVKEVMKIMIGFFE
jgi:hypothetical protein